MPSWRANFIAGKLYVKAHRLTTIKSATMPATTDKKVIVPAMEYEETIKMHILTAGKQAVQRHYGIGVLMKPGFLPCTSLNL